MQSFLSRIRSKLHREPTRAWIWLLAALFVLTTLPLPTVHSHDDAERKHQHAGVAPHGHDAPYSEHDDERSPVPQTHVHEAVGLAFVEAFVPHITIDALAHGPPVAVKAIRHESPRPPPRHRPPIA